MTTVLELSNIKVIRGSKQVLDIHSLALNRGELVSIIGPNGAGKSTLLQVINLLIPISQGSIRLYGKDDREIDKRHFRRRCSLVFQDALVLKDTVFNNVALPLRLRSHPKKEITERVMKALAAFRCAHLASRLAHQLSGGEAQRVCLARALVCEPELLLLDEPFTALDPLTRMELGRELKQVAIENNMTVLLVSHNLYDVLHFTHRAIVMQNGRIIQDDIPETILRRPANLATAKLIGMDNIISCELQPNGEGTEVRLPNGLTFLHSAILTQAGHGYCCFPGDIFSNSVTTSIANKSVRLNAQVTQITPSIGVYYIQVKCQGLDFNLKVSRETAMTYFALDESVQLVFDPQEAHFIFS